MDDGAINDMVVIILPPTMKKKKKENHEPVVVVDERLLQTYLEQVKGYLHQLERLELRRFRGNRFLLVDKSDGTELSRLMTPGEMHSRLHSLSQLLYRVHTAKINHDRRVQEAHTAAGRE
jgi:hypothetical protein